MLSTDILNANLNNQVSYYDYFKALGYTDRDKLFLRTFQDKGDKDSGHNIECLLRNFALTETALHAENEKDRGVFYVVNGGGQDDAAVKKNVRCPKAHFIDIDDYGFEEQIERINAFGLEPSIIVKTSKSLHVYWITDDSAQMDKFRAVQDGLIQFFHSDRKIINESRVMRLYGFEHRKGTPVLVKLIKFDQEIRYSQETIVKKLIEHGITKVSTKEPTAATTGGDAGGEQPWTPSGDLELIERDMQVQWFDRWRSFHHVEMLGRKTNSRNTVITAVECPWKELHTGDTGKGQSAVLIDEAGSLKYTCQHSHCADRTWKDFRMYYESKVAQRPDSTGTENAGSGSEATATAEELSKQAEEADKAAYLHTTAGANLQSFVDGIGESVNTPCLSTGFKSLDTVLDGGLYEGLITIGAISSLGKTSLVLQIADQVAEAGQDVLIFSLEMARAELMSKSISRHTLQLALAQKLDTRNAKTSRGITDGKRYANYNQTENQLIRDAISAYSKYAERIFIQEGVGSIGTKQIRETVEKHIRFTGRRPLVIVDYLQIVAPYSDRATDKQVVDNCVLELKRMSRDCKIPVIAISSFNRTGYKEAATFEQLKESGAIEYGSDIVIGLQLEGAGKKDFDPTVEKKRDPRKVELVILKNRQGKVGDKVLFDYYPMFNYFTDQGIS